MQEQKSKKVSQKAAVQKTNAENSYDTEAVLLIADMPKEPKKI